MVTDHGDLAARYRRDGYLVVPALLTSGEVEEIRGEIALICRGARGEVKGVTAVAAEEPDEAVVARYLCIDQPHKASPFLSSYLAHPPIVEVLRALIGPNVKCMQTVLFTRPAQELGMSWHQDERYIPQPATARSPRPGSRSTTRPAERLPPRDPWLTCTGRAVAHATSSRTRFRVQRGRGRDLRLPLCR